MRARTLVMPLAIGLAGYALLGHRRRRTAARDADAARADRFTRSGSLANDPSDPVQELDEASELWGTSLDVDAQSQADAEAAQDLARLEAELEAEPGIAIRAEPDILGTEAEDGDDIDDIDEDITERIDRQTFGISRGDGARRRDAGDLYGAHTPAAADREHADDDRAFDEGQNWIEALEASAVENGPEPERELAEIVDDEDVLRPPHASDTRDTPVADHGAGGRRGL